MLRSRSKGPKGYGEDGQQEEVVGGGPDHGKGHNSSNLSIGDTSMASVGSSSGSEGRVDEMLARFGGGKQGFKRQFRQPNPNPRRLGGGDNKNPIPKPNHKESEKEKENNRAGGGKPKLATAAMVTSQAGINNDFNTNNNPEPEQLMSEGDNWCNRSAERGGGEGEAGAVWEESQAQGLGPDGEASVDKEVSRGRGVEKKAEEESRVRPEDKKRLEEEMKSQRERELEMERERERERERELEIEMEKETTKHEKSLQEAQEALQRAGVMNDEDKEEGKPSEDRVLGVLDRIKILAQEKAEGQMSEQVFLTKKAELLAMEQLRREAEEEEERRRRGDGDDGGAGVLLSVGQNTPPPSPKSLAAGLAGGVGAGDSSDESSDEEIPTVQMVEAEKDKRDTFKVSDLEDFSSQPRGGPRVFGPVPESVKETIKAKELAAREPAPPAQGNSQPEENKGTAAAEATAAAKKDKKSETAPTTPEFDNLGGGNNNGNGAVGVRGKTQMEGGMLTRGSRCRCVVM
ncbi:unnamed protein product [Discosporangium mesarthrocarpum]